MKKIAMFLGVVFAMLVVGMSISDADAGFKDSFNKIREGVKNRKRSCSSCGKTIYAGSTCLTCKARATRDNVKSRAHPCSSCGKTIYAGSTCLTCKGRTVRDKGRDAWDKTKRVVHDVGENVKERAHPCSVCNRTIYVGSRCGRCLSKIVGTRGADFIRGSPERGKRLYEAAKVKYGPMIDKLRDPETRRKAGEAIGAIMEVRRKFQEAKRKGVGEAFVMLADLPLPDGGTLGELASDKLSKEFPSFVSTGIFDNPAETAASLVCDAPRFLLGEAKLLNRGGQNVSVFDAVKGASPYDSGGIVSCLKIVKATADVSHAADTGEGYVEAVMSVSKAIKSAKS